MTLLDASQITFNFVASLAIITVAVFVCVAAYEIINSIRNTKKFVKNIKRESLDVYANLERFLTNIAALPFVAALFKRKKKK